MTVLGVTVLLAVPWAAQVAGARLPVEPSSGPFVDRPVGMDSSPAVRALPVFVSETNRVVPASALDRLLDVLRPVMSAEDARVVVDATRANVSVLEYIRGGAEATIGSVYRADARYPYEYEHLDDFLDRALPDALSKDDARAMNDAAALLILVAGAEKYEPAAPTAFALLRRAREGGDCEPQLNLAMLVASEGVTRTPVVRGELQRAVDACPHDPTPLWLLGQYDSMRVFHPPGKLAPVVPREAPVERMLRSFEVLRQRFPGSHAGWSGEADAQLRLAYAAGTFQPFTARSRFQRARALYEQAKQVDDDPGLDVGLARALSGIARHDDAAAATRRAVSLRPRDIALHIRLVDVLERASLFAAAARAAGEAKSTDDQTDGTQLIPGLVHQEPIPDGVADADAAGLLSWGLGRIRPLSVQLTPASAGADGAVVLDRSFIPTYRNRPETDHNAWCLDWSRRRDLLLAGRPAEVLEGFPRQPESADGAVFNSEHPAGGGLCDDGVTIAALAALQVDGDTAASTWLTGHDFLFEPYAIEPSPRRSYLYDSLQNSQRFANDLTAARRSTDAWVAIAPASRFAWDRAGEVAFLQRRFDDAATAFERAERAARDDLDFAESQVKRAAALSAAGRHAESRELAESAASHLEQAQRAGRFEENDEVGSHRDNPARRALYLEYYALSEAGQSALRIQDYSGAAKLFAAALEVQRRYITRATATGLTLPAALSLRPEVLENNMALVLVERGEPGAIRLARRALDSDPASPIFRQTLGFALQDAGHLAQAAEHYRLALEADPTLFSAANDLGVIATHVDQRDEAIAALRQAVGAQPRYALGWFNLGVVLEHAGPRRWLESQGAFAQAARLDPSTRDRLRRVEFDNAAYFSNLDVSRPLPGEWRFTQAYERGSLGAVGGVLIVLLLRLAFALFRERLFGRVSERGARALSRRTAWGPRVLTWAPAAAVATAAVAVWPALRPDGPGPMDRWVLAVSALVLVTGFVRARVVWGRRRRVVVRHYAWTPGLVVAAATTAIGAGWMPLPVTDDESAARVAAVGPIFAAVLAALLLISGGITEVPVTRAVGAAALTMAGSMLLPVAPYDGARLPRRAVLLLDLPLLMGAALLWLGVV